MSKYMVNPQQVFSDYSPCRVCSFVCEGIPLVCIALWYA